MSWSSLDGNLWILILGHVPLPERLGSCSRVSKKLCRAAAAATEHLEVNLQRSQQRAEGVLQWLQQKGKHVTSLRLEEFTVDLTELPCRQLHDLVVSDGRVQLGPSSSHPGVLHSCSALKKLTLEDCDVVDWRDGLTALSAVPALQHLELLEVYYDDDDSGTCVTLNLPGSILQVLTQLTFLKLGGDVIEVSAESLQHISALQHLQVLSLDSPSVSLSPSSTPGLAQLTALHTLKLLNCFDGYSLDAAVLLNYSGLRQLELCAVVLTGASSGAVLLSVIGQQQQLEQLELWNVWGVLPEWPTAPAAYTVLTASSRLQELIMRLDGLPAGIWQAVFRPEQQLLHLQKLVLPCFGAADNPDVVPLRLAFSSTEFGRLVACCPALQHLELGLQPDVQLAALSQLTALTRLTIHEAIKSSVKSLSGLSRLRELTIHGSTRFSPAALLPLTALRQLASLYSELVEGFGGTNGGDLYLTCQAGDPAPDVWLQLLERISSCQPAVVRGLALQLKEQQQLVNSLQQQDRDKDQQLDAQKHIIQQLQQHVSSLEQQSVNQQQQLQQQAVEAVELRGRVARAR